ncbi:hypothetical protein T484DRAFT_1932346 [Baffinella frigidus]|nr:hypothetical protein T484DRAFT_1932346 [Cryptophyta sp. CCMP2293]
MRSRPPPWRAASSLLSSRCALLSASTPPVASWVVMRGGAVWVEVHTTEREGLASARVAVDRQARSALLHTAEQVGALRYWGLGGQVSCAGAPR